MLAAALAVAAIQLPSAHACVADGTLTLGLHARSASVRVDERRFASYGRVDGPVKLQRLPTGTLLVSVRAVGADGTTTSQGRIYVSCGDEPRVPRVSPPPGPSPRRLVTTDLRVGMGPIARRGDDLTVMYVGADFADGSLFDSSWARGRPFRFPLGAGEVIEGWERGLAGMRVGGRRELIIAPRLAYGAMGSGVIRPKETLIFVVDLLGVR